MTEIRRTTSVILLLTVALGMVLASLVVAPTAAHAAKTPGKKLSLKMWRAVDPDLNCEAHPRKRTKVSTANPKWGLIRLGGKTCGSGDVLVLRSGGTWTVARGLGVDFGSRGSCSRVEGVPKKVLKDLLHVKCKSPSAKPRKVR